MTSSLKIPVFSCKRISSPDKGIELSTDYQGEKRPIICRVGSGYMSAKSVLQINTDDNIRQMLATSRSRYSYIHKEIETTLKNRPKSFAVINGGITITAKNWTYDQSTSILTMDDPSIINGAQTRGVLEDYLEEHPEKGDDVYVRYEIIASDDEDLMSFVSITRNSQNEVQFLSILGKSKCLVDLQKSMLQYDPSYRIKTNETDGRDGDEDLIDTKKLIQILVAITPKYLTDSINQNRVGKTEAPKPNHSYKLMRALRAFQYTYENRNKSWKDLYDFYVQIAPYAWSLYNELKTDFEWSEIKTESGEETRIKAFTKKFEKKDKEKVCPYIDVDDGVIFPVLHGFSVFCEQKDGRWIVKEPDWFKSFKQGNPPELIRRKFMRAVADKYRGVTNNSFDSGIMGHGITSYNDIREIIENMKDKYDSDLEISNLRKQVSTLQKERVISE